MTIIGDWGEPDDATLIELRKTWPHACHFLETTTPRLRCNYPLWDIVLHASGGYHTRTGLGVDTHRYVCGAPCTNPRPNNQYCDSCRQRLGQMHSIERATAQRRYLEQREQMKQLALQQRHGDEDA